MHFPNKYSFAKIKILNFISGQFQFHWQAQFKGPTFFTKEPVLLNANTCCPLVLKESWKLHAPLEQPQTIGRWAPVLRWKKTHRRTVEEFDFFHYARCKELFKGDLTTLLRKGSGGFAGSGKCEGKHCSQKIWLMTRNISAPMFSL